MFGHASTVLFCFPHYPRTSAFNYLNVQIILPSVSGIPILRISSVAMHLFLSCPCNFTHSSRCRTSIPGCFGEVQERPDMYSLSQPYVFQTSHALPEYTNIVGFLVKYDGKILGGGCMYLASASASQPHTYESGDIIQTCHSFNDRGRRPRTGPQRPGSGHLW